MAVRQHMYKIIGADGQQYGPISSDQIRRWMGENRVRAETLAQAEGTTDWKPLNSFPEFADARTVPPTITPPIASYPPPNPRASNKIPAGICGIILGGFGVHKFILGYTGSGLIMLLVSLLSCGALYPIMHIIGLIEGIIYLSKSDDEFVQLYIDGRKEWF
jgi:TM2 domain-containing membrane protein YozV